MYIRERDDPARASRELLSMGMREIRWALEQLARELRAAGCPDATVVRHQRARRTSGTGEVAFRGSSMSIANVGRINLQDVFAQQDGSITVLVNASRAVTERSLGWDGWELHDPDDDPPEQIIFDGQAKTISLEPPGETWRAAESHPNREVAFEPGAERPFVERLLSATLGLKREKAQTAPADDR